MYQALYRKWRPQTFDAVIGQEHITETLKNQVQTGRLSHAYIFIGTRGTGKTTCARILARAVNCEHPVNGNPCGKCEACRAILDGDATDIVEIDAASNNGVDNVRTLREEAVFSPTKLKKRVYIIDEVHMLSASAFNALLKILEEPPAHLMFILATTELQKVPATILSRCQRHSFKRIDTSVLSDYLLKVASAENLNLTPEAARLIAGLAEGGVRDSLSLLDQCSETDVIDAEHVYSTLGLAGNKKTARILSCMITHKTADVIEDFNSLWRDGKDSTSILTELTVLLRDILLVKAAPKSASVLLSGSYDTATLSKYDKYISADEVIAMLETIQNTLSDMKLSSNPRLTAEVCLISLSANAGGDSIRSLKARISKLENRLDTGSFAAPAQAVSAPLSSSVTEYIPSGSEESFPDGSDPGSALFTETFSGQAEPYEEISGTADAPQPETDLSGSKPAAAEERPAASASTPENVLPADPVTDPEPSPVSLSETVTRNAWPEIAKKASEKLSANIGYLLLDEKQAVGEIRGDTLYYKVANSFFYPRLTGDSSVQVIAQAAREVLGQEIRVITSKLEPEKKTVKSIDDLAKFDIVHIE